MYQKTSSIGKVAISEDKVKEAKVKLAEYFSQVNDMPLVMAQTYLKSINIPLDNWSINNKFIALIVGNTRDARTYQAWKAAGRQVRYGEKAFYILAPNTYPVERVNEKTGEKEKVQVVRGFRGLAVFGIEQTTGKDVQYVETPKTIPPLMDVAEKMGLKVKYDKTFDGEWGSYNQAKDEIRLCTEDVGTFFHELAHAVHKRLTGKLKGGQDRDQEIIAEFTACVLAAVYGFDKKSFSYNYIKGYSANKEKVGEHIISVMSMVERILDYILQVSRS